MAMADEQVKAGSGQMELGLAVQSSAALVADGGSPAVAARAPRFRRVDRRQLQFDVLDVERLVDEDHPVRAIWEMTGRLDLRGFYGPIAAVEGRAGRTPLDPRLLVAVWIYAYSEGITSAREVAELLTYHPAFRWLAGLETVNYHTLSDFRTAHREALEALMAGVLGVLRSEGLVTLKRVVHDSTKVQACAGVDTFRTGDGLAACLKEAREHVEALAAEADDPTLSERGRQARRRAAEERVERLDRAGEELQRLQDRAVGAAAAKGPRVSTTDPEARVMKQGNGGYAPSYSVQISTDTAAGAIVAAAPVQEGSDQAQLMPAMDRVQQCCGQKPGEVVADAGFTHRESIQQTAAQSIVLYGSMCDGEDLSRAHLKSRGVAEEFYPEAFAYDPKQDCYICPVGTILAFAERETGPGVERYRYYAPLDACRCCRSRSKCCPGKRSRGRGVVRIVESGQVQEFRHRMETDEGKAAYRQRGQMAEFPNAWLKEKLGLRRFRLRGLAKVTMEVQWACLTYNLQLWIRRCWLPARLAA
jgi:transposase